jgi:hypothetical protein
VEREEPAVSRVTTATRLGFREQARRPLLLVLLVGLPFFFITRAIAQTERLPRTITLPGNGGELLTNMRDIHGADMAVITVAFLAALVGVFVMQSARQADRRLVVAGYRPWQALAPRLLVLAAAIAVVLAVSLAVTALSFSPTLWLPFAVAGVIYGLLGALAGAAVGRLGATYLMLFAAMLDLGIVQNPMFGSGEPPAWGALLPGYGPGRVIIDGAFSEHFHAWAGLAIGLAWSALLVVAVLSVLGRLVTPMEGRDSEPRAVNTPG